jgi:YfiH family protein
VTLSLRSELLRSFGFRHGFSLRTGGVSLPPYSSLNLGRSVGDDLESVARNQRLFAAEVGYAEERLYEVSQVHGGAVEVVEGAVAPEQFRLREADALLSLTEGCAVAIRTADCVPLLLADRATGAVAAVHAGWRGVVADVVGAAVTTLCERAGSSPGALVAAIFPAISAAAFEVGAEVAEQIVAALRDRSVVQQGAARPHVDLARAVRLQLERAGLAAERIEQLPGCTFGEHARFFSFRRDGGRTGRHLAAILPRC